MARRRDRILGATIAAIACLAGAAASAARSPAPAPRFDSAASDAPGGPRPPDVMTRLLLEDGYAPLGPLAREGALYFVAVTAGGRPLCLALDAFSGAILQAFAVTPKGLGPLVAASPGPGFASDPRFPTGRAAQACFAGSTAAR